MTERRLCSVLFMYSLNRCFTCCSCLQAFKPWKFQRDTAVYCGVNRRCDVKIYTLNLAYSLLVNFVPFPQPEDGYS